MMALAAFSKHVKCLCHGRFASTLSTVSKQLGAAHRLPECLISIDSFSSANPSSHAGKSCLESASDLQIKFGQMTLSRQSGQPSREYHLPTTWYNHLQKKTILDPTSGKSEYRLPTIVNREIEKFDPSFGSLFPILDPSPLQRIIDQGAPPITMETLPYLITIRHKKMKKHQLKKLKKRMRFLRRKLEAVKRKKKEKVLQAYEKDMLKWSTEFDADKFVDGRLERARKSGWQIDILAERTQRLAATKTGGTGNLNE